MKEKMIDRYSRQILFSEIGEEGQRKLNNSSVVIVGCGALGTIIATSLVRSGVGKIRVIDRDFIEYHNLHRQILYTEEDVEEGIPKAKAAEAYLKKVNSSIEIEGVVADINYTNIEELVAGADLIMDGLDNLEARLLVNDVSLKSKIPWIYGGAISASGMTMNIIPDKTPCFRCVWASPTAGSVALTCDTAGVINPAPLIVGSIQSVEAMKMLTGAPELNNDLIMIDIWREEFSRLKVNRRADCPACNGEYEFLNAKFGTRTTSLCGQNSVQILNTETRDISFEKLADRLSSVGKVTYNEFILRFQIEDKEMVIFPDGRAIVKNTNDETMAKGLYAKYIGM